MKKFLAMILALAMVFSLAACGGNNDDTSGGGQDTSGGGKDTSSGGSELAGTYDITIWCPDAAVSLTEAQVKQFNATNTMGITINATVQPVSEADAATNMVNDVSAGGDLYFFAQDQLSRLIQAAALMKLGQGAADYVKNNNVASSLVAAKSGDDFFAYPLTADNGYFMYYDKSVIPEEDIDSLEKLVADCEAAGKNFSYELENAWYTAGFFFAAGCHSDWITDNDGKFISIDDDFNSDKGLIAAKGLQKIVTSKSYVNSSAADFASGSAVVVTGVWNYADIKAQLGDNFGVTDLPSFEVDGQSYHIGSYAGCKLLGVKPQEDAKKGAVVNQLAQYLTGKECSLQRAADPVEGKTPDGTAENGGLGWGPANLEARNDPAGTNPALAALEEQNKYSVSQPNIHGSWWDIAKVIATDIKTSDGSETALKAALQKYEDSISAVFEMSDEVKNAWTVIGNIGGSNWDVDFEMTADGDIWTSKDAFEMTTDSEFKVRQGKSWDVNYGANATLNGDNIKPEAAGTYKVQLNAATGEVTLLAQ